MTRDDASPHRPSRPCCTPAARAVLLATLLAFGQGLPATAPARDLEVVENSLGMRLVRVPAGEFEMGSEEPLARLRRAYPGYPDNVIDGFGDESPVRRVRITRDFYLGQHEVTRGQFRRFLERSGYVPESIADGTGGYGYDPAHDPRTKPNGELFAGRSPRFSWIDPGWPQTDDHPVVNVSWNDAVAMARWLTTTERVRYRLPTEAEWEYACRAGTRTRYHSGDDPRSLARVGNLFERETARVWPSSLPRPASWSDGFAFTAPVGRFAPNPFGLHDMHGNVWEWTADVYAPYGHARAPVDDPTGPADGELRVRRGGSWRTWPPFARCSYRNWNTPQTRYVLVGFRLVREIDADRQAPPHRSTAEDEPVRDRGEPPAADFALGPKAAQRPTRREDPAGAAKPH